MFEGTSVVLVGPKSMDSLVKSTLSSSASIETSVGAMVLRIFFTKSCNNNNIIQVCLSAILSVHNYYFSFRRYSTSCPGLPMLFQVEKHGKVRLGMRLEYSMRSY